MNLEDFPDPIKKDIEDSSLSILKHINDEIILIGGWAVRALIGDRHGRYTLDIDGITDINKIEEIESKLASVGMNTRKGEWGIQFYHKYNPRTKIPIELKDEIEKLELRIEISGPKIKESQTSHYFEFSLIDYKHREISYHVKEEKVKVKVPSAEYLAADKLGLPVDYKNNLDSQLLLDICDVDRVVEVIRGNDNWAEMVTRRIPKLIGRLSQKDRLEHILATNIGINIKEHVKIMKYIDKKIKC